MKNFSMDDLKNLVADAKNTENKKTFYIVLGVFVALLAITGGLVALLVKKHCICCECDDFYDDWDDEEDEECFEDDFETEDEK